MQLCLSLNGPSFSQLKPCAIAALLRMLFSSTVSLLVSSSYILAIELVGENRNYNGDYIQVPDFLLFIALKILLSGGSESSRIRVRVKAFTD